MKKNIVLNYDEVLDVCKKIINKPEMQNVSAVEEKIGETITGIPINKYSMGTGTKHIVVSGAVHGSELISTDFVLNLMNELSNNPEKIESMSEYTLDFIPVVNPEGYIITSTAVQKMIPNDEKERENFYNKYYWAYRLDDQIQISINKNNPSAVKIEEIPEEFPDLKQKAIDFRDRADGSVKLHQQMFENVTWEDIPDKYPELKANLKRLYEKYNYPAGAMIDWSANGEGIDLNANSEYNSKIKEILEGKELYNNFRHSNLKTSNPGPINCPFDKEKGFEKTLENVALSGLLEKLHEKDELSAYFNYHGTGAVIYQRPLEIPEKLNENNIKLDEKTIQNYLTSKFYSEKTFDVRNKNKYRILTGNGKATSANDIFRLLYPNDILVELSGRGGNPIAPFYNENGSYNEIINSNIDGFMNAVQVLSLSDKVAKSANKVINKIGFMGEDELKEFEEKRVNDNEETTPVWNNNGDDLALKKYEVLDMVYDEFSKRLDQLQENKGKVNSKIEKNAKQNKEDNER